MKANECETKKKKEKRINKTKEQEPLKTIHNTASHPYMGGRGKKSGFGVGKPNQGRKIGIV